MGSTRLHRNFLKYLNKKDKVIEFLIKQLKFSNLTDDITIATMNDDENSQLIDIVKNFNVFYFVVGNEKNVFERYYKAVRINEYQ